MAQGTPQIEEIRRILRDFASLDIESDLIRTEDLGKSLDFSKFKGTFHDFKNFAAASSEMAWDALPEVLQGDVLQGLQALKHRVDRMQSFSSESGNPSARRDALAQEFYQSFRQTLREMSPFLAYVFRSSFDFSDYRSSTDDLLATLRDQAEHLGHEVEVTRQQADSALSAIREAAAEQGVSQEAAVFKEAAERYEQSATTWLRRAVGAGVVTVGAAFGLFWLWTTEGQITDSDILQLVLIKAAVLAVLTYATATAVRFYRSNSHLAVVNRHREDALRTFRSFVEGSDSPETKDQVLLAAARAAFGQTPTGLVSEKGDGGSVLEVLAGIANNMGRRP